MEFTILPERRERGGILYAGLVASLVLHFGAVGVLVGTVRPAKRDFDFRNVHHVKLVDLPGGDPTGQGGEPGEPAAAVKPAPEKKAEPRVEPPSKPAVPVVQPEEKPKVPIGKQKKKRGRTKPPAPKPSRSRGKAASKPLPGRTSKGFDEFVLARGVGLSSGGSGGSGGGGGGGTATGSMAVDSSDFHFLYYLNIIREKVSGSWIPPAGALTRSEGESGGSARAVIQFRILPNGDVISVGLEESSGVSLLDSSALRAIRAAAPFPPLPYEYAGENLGVHFGFTIHAD